MKWLLNLLAKLSGAGKLWSALDGKKSYLAGGSQLAGGAASILSGVAALLAQGAALGSLGDAVGWAKGIPQDQAWGLVLLGWKMVADGLATVGLRHAHEKAAAPVEAK